MRLIAVFLILSLFNCEVLFGNIQTVNFYEREFNECLLPEEHPLHKQLNHLFEDKHMFATLKHFEEAGFHIISRKDNKIMVAKHPAIKNYLIKKFSNLIPQEEQLVNYLKRIAGAKALREFIYLNHLEHIVVPQKWIYPLPNTFLDPETGERTYILIVEDMDICSGKGKRDGETARKYRNIDNDTLKELCIVVYYFRGLDSGPCNMPFTHQNKIAFIDTECWDEWNREGFLPRIMPYLKQNRQRYALNIFQELCEQDKRSTICK